MNAIAVGLLILVLAAIAWLLSGHTSVIRVSNYKPQPKELHKGDLVAPLKDFDFSQGQWKAVLIIDPNDFNRLDKKIPKARCLMTNDVNVLKEMQQTWHFVVEGGDLATVTSSILFVRDGKLVFESGIVLEDGNEGLQSPDFGWVVPTQKDALLDSCKKFKGVHSPVVFY